MNNFLNGDIIFKSGRIWNFGIDLSLFLPTNTISYMAGSTASQVTMNLVNGRKAFKDVDYGINWGMLISVSTDLIKNVKPIRHGLANKYNKQYPERQIRTAVHDGYRLADNGDLWVKLGIEGLAQHTEQPIEFAMDVFYNTLYPVGSTYSTLWNVNGVLIPNYRNIVQTIYNLRLY